MVATSPTYFDAKDWGLLSPVLDQGNCLACTSFTLVRARPARRNLRKVHGGGRRLLARSPRPTQPVRRRTWRRGLGPSLDP